MEKDDFRVNAAGIVDNVLHYDAGLNSCSVHYDAGLNRQRCVLQICCQGQTSRRCENTDPSENLVGDVTPVVPSIENESTEECLTDLLRSEQNEAVVH